MPKGDSEGFNVEVFNPNLKYDLLEYLVVENNEVEAMQKGINRGGRSRIMKESDKEFNDMGMVVLSKYEPILQTKPISGTPKDEADTRPASGVLPSELFKDDWARLKH